MSSLRRMDSVQCVEAKGYKDQTEGNTATGPTMN